MASITVRISEEEKRRLLKRGNLSASVREALRLYLDSENSSELLRRLEKLQRKNPTRTTPADEVRLINEDRKR